jgi:hypothetical protein
VPGKLLLDTHQALQTKTKTMANEQEANRKLLQLASRVKRAPTTHIEDVRLNMAIRDQRISSRTDVAKVLEESLQKSAAEVGTVLASDDSDRLVDEIVQALSK